ncbi:MAG: PrsW family intramembrane metalloprotease [Parcubacteria group bacterium]|nr:PrsW family intramembrane metalloprotease [Parcubacteria group bacterium]MCR4342925.1 PrsW family intramembrane metalloprotease [Patescibacteria group bacterium]
MASLITFSILMPLATGIIPALIWLWFWLKEDRKYPEPKRLIVLTFIFGMIFVFMALALEYLLHLLIKGQNAINIDKGIIFLLSLAFIEEIMKYFAARPALKSKNFDEPIDAVMYLIIASLGFAAMENIFFLISTFKDGGMTIGFLTGDMRFLGANLLHSMTSAVIGISIAMSYYRRKTIKITYLSIGVILATLLHAIFNLYIIKMPGQNSLNVFLGLWIFTIIIILAFEKVKRIKLKQIKLE